MIFKEMSFHGKMRHFEGFSNLVIFFPDLEFIPIDRKFFLDIIGPMGARLIVSGPRRY